ncbi:alpha-2-macroglobulin family protein, partial [human gut metagenome]
MEEEQALVEGAAKAEMDKAPGVAVRENLNETAFFYPRLMADTSGVVTLRFTLPESLTTWKFMALAHTKDMMAGLLTDEVVAAKEVMAQLSLPRFVRMGDRVTLSATLFNLTEKTLEGKATMEVFDPATGEGLWKETVKVEM